MKYENLLDLVQETHRVAQIRAIKVVDQSLLIRRMRAFYLQYPQVSEVFSVVGTPLTILNGIQEKIPNPLLYNRLQIRSPAVTEFNSNRPTTTIVELRGHHVINLSWARIQELTRIDDPLKRAFYENGCLIESWTLATLRRHINSLLYERTGLSTDKEAVIRNARIGLTDPEKSNTHSILDIIRDPYILEYSGLKADTAYLESDLEKALLDHLQGFLLELGNGFCFEARQKRICLEDENDWIDLVFYNRLLRCHVLIDLKVREFRHGDAGQMNFYLNWWKDHGMSEGDQPPVGLILCTDKKSVRVQYATAGMDQSLFVSRYMVQLPKPEDLQGFLEHDRAFLEQKMEASV